MCETVCKSVCFVSFRQELPAPHDSLSLHIFILCPFRYQPRYYRFRPFSEPEPGDIVSQIRHFFLRLLQGLKAVGWFQLQATENVVAGKVSAHVIVIVHVIQGDCVGNVDGRHLYSS